MTDYTKATNFTSKDSLSTGNPLKIVKGTEIDTEFNNIQTAVATKTDNATAAITGGSITGVTISSITDLAVTDGGTGASTASGARTNLGAAASGANSDITSITGLTTPLTVAQGGTGAATLTANNVLLGNGTSALQAVAPGSSGNVLTSNGTTWQSSTPASAPVSSVNGVTGAVVTTTVDNIGCVLTVANCSTSNLYTGQTIAGSSLYYPSTYTGNEGNKFYTQGTTVSSTAFTNWDTSSMTKTNSGNTGFQNPSGATACSGTYRILSFALARTSVYDACGLITISSARVCNAVRIS